MPFDTETTKTNHARRIAQFVLIGLSALLAALLIFFIIQFINTLRASTVAAFNDAQAEVSRAAAELDVTFGSAMEITEALADDLSSGALPFDDAAIENRLRTLIEERPDLYGISAAFAPDAFPSDNRLHVIYLYRDEDGEIVADIRQSRYDYTQPPGDDPEAPQTGWYLDPDREWSYVARALLGRWRQSGSDRVRGALLCPGQ